MISELFTLLKLKGSLIAGGVMLALLAGSWGHGCQTGVERERERQALITAKALEKARVADSEAAEAVVDTLDEVEQEIEDAREAADASDDPLAAILDSLRGD